MHIFQKFCFIFRYSHPWIAIFFGGKFRFPSELCMGRPGVTHLKIGNPWNPMGPHWVNCKNLFSKQILSDKMHIAWKFLNFCIDSNKKLCKIENAFRFIWGFLKSSQSECFEISLIFHGFLPWLQKKIKTKICVNWSQESLEKKIHGYPLQCSDSYWNYFYRHEF